MSTHDPNCVTCRTMRSMNRAADYAASVTVEGNAPSPQGPSLLMDLHAIRARGEELVQAATHLMERVSGDIHERTPYLVGANQRLTRTEELRALPGGAVVRTKGVVYVKSSTQPIVWVAAVHRHTTGVSSEEIAASDDGIAVLHEGKF